MGKSIDIIWSRFVSGDRKAFELIYDQYFPQLYAYSIGKLKDISTAEDIVAEVFLKLLNYPAPGEIQQIENWLFTVTKNAALSHLTKQQRRLEILQGMPRSNISKDAIHHQQQLDLKTLDGLLASQLKEDDYQLWQLHMEGYDNQEIAGKLKMKEKTVANRKTMLKSSVREIIQEMNREKRKG